ncbi:MAG: diphthine--ammonia ligase [Nitrososphaerota archaeon]|nr:diphthine--ammonia ligase [Nitrososphaerota archaeon]
MRVGVLWSGGKDSTYAAWLASKKEELACLVTITPKSDESYMFHYPDLKWTALQAEAMGVPQLTSDTEGVKEEELKDLEDALGEAKSRFSLEGVYTGALGSVYQKSRVEKACGKLGLTCVSPLWGADPEAHLRRLISDGFSVMMVSVSALGLDEGWLGRVLDDGAVDELVALGRKYRFHVGLEGGEGETFVLDAPMFSKKVEVRSALNHWRGDRGYLEITDARLIPKSSPRVEAAWSPRPG